MAFVSRLFFVWGFVFSRGRQLLHLLVIGISVNYPMGILLTGSYFTKAPADIEVSNNYSASRKSWFDVGGGGADYKYRSNASPPTRFASSAPQIYPGVGDTFIQPATKDLKDLHDNK